MNIMEMKHRAKLQEWSEKIAECRGSGKTVKEWCREQGLNTKTYYYWEKAYVTEATRKNGQETPGAGMLMRVEPEMLAAGETETNETVITVRHGGSVILLPAGSRMEAVAELVQALNRHA